MTPAGRIDPQPWMTAGNTRAVLKALVDGGAAVRFVGGCMRDAVLGRAVKDVDIATDAGPDAVLAALRAAGIRAIPTGLAHGTVTAISGGRPFEVTTLRRDVETFGRHARVAFTDDWAEDAARRDLTINALYGDPDGTLYDPVGGLDDLNAGLVRFIGDPRARIGEDVLRLLRFFRFRAWYGRGPADAAALAACTALAPKLETLSAERVWAELKRLLAAPGDAPAAMLAEMRQAHVLEHVVADAARLDRLRTLCRIELGLDRDPDPVRRLAAAFDLDGHRAEALGLRLRLSNADRGRLVRLAAPEATVAPDMDERARHAALYRLGADIFADLALLGWAGEAAAAGDGIAPDAAPAWRALLDAAAGWQEIALPVGGKDAMALGMEKGPAIGNLLNRVEAWWIAEDFRPGRKACLEKLKAFAQAAR